MHARARHKTAALLALAALLLACGLGLAACAGPGADTASLAQDCLWVLWVKNPAQAKEAAAQLAAGRKLALVGRELARQGKGQATLDTGCPALGELPSAVVQAAARLKPGQVSQAFPLRGGTAFVMRGSDRHRLLSLHYFREKRFAEAQREALADLELNPANNGSWLVLGQSRAALDDREGALRALDQGLLLDPNDPELAKARQDLMAQAPAKPPIARPLPAVQEPRPAPVASEEEAPLAPVLPAPEVSAPPAPAPAPASQPPTPAAAPAPVAPQGTDTSGNVQARQLAAQAARILTERGDLAKAQDLAHQALLADANYLEAWLTLGKIQEARGLASAATLTYHEAAQLDPASEEARAGLRRSFLALPKADIQRLDSASLPAARPAPRAAAGAPALASPASPGQGPARPETAGQTPASHQVPPGIYVQVASEPERSGALREAKAWRDRGYGTLILPWRGPDGKAWQRVLVGPYPNRQQARHQAQEMKARHLISFYLLVEMPPR